MVASWETGCTFLVSKDARCTKSPRVKRMVSKRGLYVALGFLGFLVQVLHTYSSRTIILPGSITSRRKLTVPFIHSFIHSSLSSTATPFPLGKNLVSLRSFSRRGRNIDNGLPNGTAGGVPTSGASRDRRPDDHHDPVHRQHGPERAVGGVGGGGLQQHDDLRHRLHLRSPQQRLQRRRVGTWETSMNPLCGSEPFSLTSPVLSREERTTTSPQKDRKPPFSFHPSSSERNEKQR